MSIENLVSLCRSHLGEDWIALFWVVVAGLLLMAMPPLVLIPQAGLDPSWQLSLGMAFAQGLTFGRQYLWTYGPLGFLHDPYFYPDHALWAWSALVRAGSQTALDALFLVTVSRILVTVQRVSQARRYTVLGIMVMVLFFSQPGFGVDYDLVLIGIFLLLNRSINWMRRPQESRWNWILVVIASAILATASMIKSSVLLISIPTLTIFDVLTFSRRMRPQGVALLLFVLSFVGIWAMFEPVAALPNYLLGTAQLVLGYSSAMSIPGYLVQTVPALMVLATLLVWFLTRLYGRKLDMAVEYFVLGSMLVFEVWKEGFVRHDRFLIGGHAVIFFSVITVFLALLALLERSLWRRAFIFETVVLSAFSVIGNGYYAYNISPMTFVHNIRQTASLLISTKNRTVLTAQADSEIRSSRPLPTSILKSLKDHPVDVFPWDTALVAGYRLKWDPSPIVQSYSAYTPYLDYLNASQLRTHGASRILFSYEDIDGRYPIFDEPATFLQLLKHYRFSSTSGNISLLLRTKHSVAVKPQAIWSGTIAVNRKITLPLPPGRHAVLLRLNIGKSLLGTLASFFFKPSPFYISMTLANHSTVGPYRLVPSTAQDGLFISPYIANLQQLDTLASRHWVSSSNEVTAMTLSTNNASEYRPVIKAQLVGLPHFFANASGGLPVGSFFRWDGQLYETGASDHIYRLKGYTVPNDLIDHHSTSIARYKLMGTLRPKALKSGSLVRFVANPTVYVVQGHEFVGIPSPQVFNQHHFQWSAITVQPGPFVYRKYHISRNPL